MEFQCPHCSLNMSAENEHAGKVVACPGCNGRFEIPALPEPTPASATTFTTRRTPQSQRGGWPEEDHANVRFDLSFGIAVVVTATFLFALVPFQGSGFSDIFLKRGWVNYAEVFLFIWGLVILVMKLKKAKRQSQAMLLDILPSSLGHEINNSNVGHYIEHIYKLPIRLRDSLMVNRIRKGLELFEKRNNNSEVVAILNAQSDIDANRISGSYTLLKVFLWAIPILGFIGTVQGLSTAVSALSMGDTSDPAALKSSIDSLTGGLGVAFDTTLLGLILSMFMSFPMAAVQKAEDETLTIIDAFCTEKLLPKLNDSRNASTGELLEQAESIPQLVASLARAHETFLVNLNGATQMLSQAGDTMNKRLATHQETVEKSFTEAVSKLSDTGIEVFIRSQVEMTKTLEKMATGIELLNKALRDIGANQIPDTAKKKRGFFGR